MILQNCDIIYVALRCVSHLSNFLQLAMFEVPIQFLSRRLTSNFIHFVAEMLPTGEVQATRVVKYSYTRQLYSLKIRLPC